MFFWGCKVGILWGNASELEKSNFSISSVGVLVILQGDPNLSISVVSLKALWKAVRQQGEAFLVELSYIRVLEN